MIETGLTIVRTHTVDNSLFGKVYLNSKLFGVTLENWKLSIPEGIYELVPYKSPKHGWTYVLVNESLGVYFTKPEEKFRDKCEIHSANWSYQLKGCNAFGRAIETIMDELGISDSKRTVRKVLKLVGIYKLKQVTIVHHKDYPHAA